MPNIWDFTGKTLALQIATDSASTIPGYTLPITPPVVVPTSSGLDGNDGYQVKGWMHPVADLLTYIAPMFGDLSGSLPTPTVVGLQTIPVQSGTPTDGFVLTYVALNNQWEPKAVSSGSVTLGGDVTGIASANTVSKLQGVTLTATAPTTGNSLNYNGTAWVPAAINLAGGSSYVTGSLPTANQAAQTMGGDVSGTTASAVVVKLQGYNISNAIPTTGYVLGWNGTNWISTNPATLTSITWANDLAGSTNTNQYVAAISGNAGAGGTLPVNVNILQFGMSQASPTIQQATLTSDVSASTFSLYSQAAYPSASINKNAGTFFIDTGAPVSGGFGALNIGISNATAIAIGHSTATLSISAPTINLPQTTSIQTTGTAHDFSLDSTQALNLGVNTATGIRLGKSGTNSVTFTTNSVNWSSSMSSPSLTQSAPSSDLATATLTIASQSAYSLASTNKNAGTLILNSGAPASGGTSFIEIGVNNATQITLGNATSLNGSLSLLPANGHLQFQFYDNATINAVIANQGAFSGSTDATSLWMNPGVSPTTSNFALSCTHTTGNTSLNAPTNLYFDIAGTIEMAITTANGHSQFIFYDGVTLNAVIANQGSVLGSTAATALWMYPGVSPTSSNFTLACTSVNTSINAATNLYGVIGGNPTTLLTASAYSPYTAGLASLGTPSLYWSELYTPKVDTGTASTTLELGINNATQITLGNATSLSGSLSLLPASGHIQFQFYDNSTLNAVIANQGAVSGSTAATALWMYPGVSPTSSNFTVACTSVNTSINAATNLYGVIGGNEKTLLTSAAYSPFTDGLISNGTASLRWSAVYTQPPQADSNTLHQWKCTDASGSGTIVDSGSAGSGSNLTVQNSSFTNQGDVGLFSDCITFTASTSSSGWSKSSVNVGVPSSTTAISISAWIYPINAFVNSFPRIISLVNSGLTGDIIAIILNGTTGQAYAQWTDSGGQKNNQSIFPATSSHRGEILLNVWQHIAVTFSQSGTTMTLTGYWNGNQIGQSTTTSGAIVYGTPGPWVVGGIISTGLSNATFNGMIADARVDDGVVRSAAYYKAQYKQGARIFY